MSMLGCRDPLYPLLGIVEPSNDHLALRGLTDMLRRSLDGVREQSNTRYPFHMFDCKGGSQSHTK